MSNVNKAVMIVVVISLSNRLSKKAVTIAPTSIARKNMMLASIMRK